MTTIVSSKELIEYFDALLDLARAEMFNILTTVIEIESYDLDAEGNRVDTAWAMV